MSGPPAVPHPADGTPPEGVGRVTGHSPAAAPAPGSLEVVAGRPTYRIEHRCGDAVAVLGYSDDPRARYTALTPLAVQLLDAGATGVLLLVEQTTGDVLARWALLPPGADAAAIDATLRVAPPVPATPRLTR